VLSLRQGSFDPASTSSYEDIRFDQSPVGDYCNNCAVTLAPDFMDLYAGTPSGTPLTNLATNVVGTTGYAPPLFANAANVGTPLTLNPNELGLGLSTDTEAPPQGIGLKLRVECSSTGTHNMKIVALAGSSSTETLIADGIGNHTIASCP
jgi:hypothetical protein